MARNFYELQEELESSDNPYRNTVQMEHGSFVSPYQQFKQQYPELDAYGNKVVKGGYFKDNIRRFAQAGRNARLEIQGQPPETEDTLLDFFGVGAMTAFHGSPHKFAKFSTKNIGTGEGAQAYGHGLYFAENPKVAGEYQKNVKDMVTVRSINDELSAINKEMNALESGAGYRKYTDQAKGDALAKQYDDLMIKRANVTDLKGSLYEVDIPDEHIKNFLDWDAPLSEQPESVRKAIGKFYKDKEPDGFFKNIDGTLDEDISGNLYHDEIAQEIRAGFKTNEEARAANLDKLVADYLNENGIKGIKYFDGSSRSAGEGTRNLVVFDENIVKT